MSEEKKSRRGSLERLVRGHKIEKKQRGDTSSSVPNSEESSTDDTGGGGGGVTSTTTTTESESVKLRTVGKFPRAPSGGGAASNNTNGATDLGTKLRLINENHERKRSMSMDTITILTAIQEEQKRQSAMLLTMSDRVNALSLAGGVGCAAILPPPDSHDCCSLQTCTLF